MTRIKKIEKNKNSNTPKSPLSVPSKAEKNKNLSTKYFNDYFEVKRNETEFKNGFKSA